MRLSSVALASLVVLGLAMGAVADKKCEECWGKTSGPCRHNLDWSCHEYSSGGVCPPGTTECGPIDCVVSEWSKWSECDEDCGGGFQSRTRTVKVPAAHGGAKCPVLKETRECNTHKCEKDICKVSEWGAWGKCSASCGGGVQTRERKVVSGFLHCPKLSDSRACNEHSCKDCSGCRDKTSGPCMHDAKGDFTCFDYFPGTEQCPPGSTACAVKKTDFEALGGKPGDGKCSDCFGKSSGPCMHDAAPVCHEYMAGTTTCPPGTHLCAPVNCEVSEWSKWNKCSANCGGGVQQRSRKVTVEPSNGGAKCPHLSEEQKCNTDPCIPKCNKCTGKSAGPCQHDKDNTCHSYMKGSKSTCPPGTHECVAQDCVVSEWGKWSKCDAECDGGNQYRSRKVVIEPTKGGKSCPHLEEAQSCNTHKCPHCATCLGKSSGPCQHDKVPVCYDYYYGTSECPAGTHDCKVAKKDFESLGVKPGDGNCDACFGKSAGPCRHNADSSCHDFIPGTKDCPSGTTACAPVNCEVSAWSKWGKCSASCGGGSQSRSRTVTVEPSNGGAKCPHLDEDQSCNTHKCIPKCNKCTLGTYGPCQHDKDNTCFDYFTKGGLKECPAGTHECKVQDCVVSEWTKWGKCSVACGGGSQSRSRKVLIEPSKGGEVCPHLTEDQSCNKEKCAHCTGCAGKSAGPCRHDANYVCHDYYAGTTTCPAGTTECAKKVKATFGALGDESGDAGDGMCSGCFGKSAGPCRHVKDSSCYAYTAGTTTCPPGTAPCAPVNCEVSAWSKWGKCSVTCGGGSQQRSRSVTVEPSNGGTKCPHLEEDQSCNTHKCPVLCDHCGGKSSGPCLHDKDGTCHNYQSGTTCPAGTTQCVNQDCVVSDWSAWGKCSANCGGGVTSRTRKVLQEASKFGQQCPELVETNECNTHKCAGCAGCAGKSAGPCQQVNNNVCHDYYKGTTTCPAGTVECTVSKKTFDVQGGKPGSGECSGCFGKSAGPCQHLKDTSCYGYMYGTTTCPPGTAPCKPVNCEVSAWSKWGKCSAECGGGSQSRSRAVTVPPSNGGAKCPHLEEDQVCNTHKCPPACTECYKKSAGPCRHDKDGTCHAYNTGTTTCPAGTTQCEDRDCVVSDWSKWSKCSVNCGGGLQQRTRSVLTTPTGKGKACPHLEEAQDCNTHKCHSCVGCVGGTSGPCQHDKDNTCFDYFPGTKNCPAGSTACTVKKTDFATLGGKPGDGKCTDCFGKSSGPCQHDKDSSCHEYMWGTTMCPPGTHACAPVNCEVSEWSKWSECSAKCGGGKTTRTRSVKVWPSNGGAKCPALEEVDVHCNEHACPIKCSACAAGTSGNCQHDKDGTCFPFFTKGGLNECPAGTHECYPVDCVVGEWSKWGKCSANCGGGSQTRTRGIKVHPKDGGKECPALSEDQSCNTHKCPHCVGCAAKTSGPCQHDKAAVCYDYYAGTTNCPAGTHDCSKKPFGTFGLLGDAAGAPGDGQCRGCYGKSEGPCMHNADTSCHGFMEGTTTCPPGTTQCKPVNCEVSAWSAWNKCSVKCGGGVQQRSRKVTVEPQNGGTKCPHLSEEQKCNTDACKPVCNACAGKSGGPCQQVKDDTCHAYMKGTKTCPAGTIECAVPVDCEVSAWSKWSACSAKCGGGKTTRTRTVKVAAANGGKECPALEESDSCNTHKCEWCSGCAGKSAGPCKQTNNGVCHDYYKGTTVCPAGTTACVHTKSSLLEVTLADAPKGDGMCSGCFGKSAGPCKHLKDTSCYNYMYGTTTCPPGTAPCAPVDCVVSEWSKWNKCSVECGGGSQQRSRYVKVAPSNGGQECPHLKEDQSCNTHKCPVRCDECAKKSSGPCRHDKDGTCHEFSKAGGCPAGTTICAEVDCEVSEWGAWGKCDAVCGGGQQQRTRKVTVAPTNGGKACPHLTEAQSCNTHKCVNCAGCLGKSTGPCMHEKVAVCYGYYTGTTTCPAGTFECSKKALSLGVLGGKPGDGKCSGCFGKSAGPCQNIKDNVCHEFMAGSYTCPPGTAPCQPNNCVVSAWSKWSKCTATCGGGVQSRSRSVLKEPTNGGAKCPALWEEQACNSHKCGAKKEDAPKCGKCAGKSSGPCRQLKDNVCHDYYFGTSICPAGTAPCVLCDKCDGKTSGPCQHDKDGSCHAYQVGTTCPAGTHECGKKFDNGDGGDAGGDDGSKDGFCSTCWPGTAGPCQQKNTVCHAYFPGTTTCPGGTYECKKSGSFPAKPLVVFDIEVEGEFDEDAFESSMAGAAGLDAGSVVVEVVTATAAGATVGFVVVSDDPMTAASAVSTALETNQVSAGFAGMNKPAEVSLGSQALSAQSGSALSTTAIALIAVGAVAGLVLVVAAVTLKRRSSSGFLRTSSSKVMTINIPNTTNPHAVAARVSKKTSRRAAELAASASDSDDDTFNKFPEVAKEKYDPKVIQRALQPSRLQPLKERRKRIHPKLHDRPAFKPSSGPKSRLSKSIAHAGYHVATAGLRRSMGRRR